MNRFGFVFSAFAASLIALCSGLSIAETPQPKQLNVGVILPMSGEAAGMGMGMKKGFEFGLSKLPPEIRNAINVRYEDDQLNPKNSVLAYYKLQNDKPLDILINAFSATGAALAALAEKDRVPFISISSDAAVSQGRKYSFNFWVTPEAEAEVALKEMRRRGYKKLARITTLHVGTRAVKTAVDAANKGEFQFPLDEEYPLDSKNFNTYLARLRNQKDIDAVMVILLPGQCGMFAKQLVESGIKTDFFGFEIFEDSTQVELSGGALIGRWYINADDPDNSFLDAFREKYPGIPVIGASNSHDAALLIGEGLKKGKDKDSFVEYLETLKDFKGALGVYSASGDHRFKLPATIKVVTKTGFEKLKIPE